MTDPSPDARRTRLMIFRGAMLGAVIGSAFGAWTARSQPPPSSLVVPTARPAAIEHCPDGYTRLAQFDPSAVVDGTAVRWLARCDPRQSNAPISESLEILWSDRVQLDPRTRTTALTEFVRTVAQGSHLLLEPLHEVEGLTLRGVPATVLEADGALRLPPMSARVWVLPAGVSTIEVMAFAPREHMAPAIASAQRMMQSMHDLAPWNEPPSTTRGWSIQAICPSGFTDSTPPGGGVAIGMFVGRYCIAPDELGGAEIVVAQMPGVARTEDGVRHVFDLAAQSTQAVGVSTGAGFGPTEHETVQGLDVSAATVEIDTPSARIHLRAYMAPAGNATAYALATTMFDHAATARETLEHWIVEAAPVRPYDPQIFRDYKTHRVVGTVILPALMTALLGAILGLLIARGVLKFGE